VCECADVAVDDVLTIGLHRIVSGEKLPRLSAAPSGLRQPFSVGLRRRNAKPDEKDAYGVILSPHT